MKGTRAHGTNLSKTETVYEVVVSSRVVGEFDFVVVEEKISLTCTLKMQNENDGISFFYYQPWHTQRTILSFVVKEEVASISCRRN